jgi:tetraacyldisaccharide 4'-kinase
MMRAGDVESWIVDGLWTSRSTTARVARSILLPLSLCFRAGVRFRNALYDHGLVGIARAPVPVISVGNLRVGGSGKTPVVLWLVERLREQGHRPLVVARGYGGSSEDVVMWVGGDIPDANAAAIEQRGFALITEADSREARFVADEVRLVAARSRVPASVSPRRACAASLATLLGCDCVILDDGFQHRGLARDLDVVLVATGDDTSRVLPCGPLREPWSALHRADVVLGEDAGAKFPSAAVSGELARHTAGVVENVDANAPVTPVECLHDREVIAVAAIARPSRFFDLLASIGARVREAVSFRDHHRYTAEDWREIRGRARQGEWIVTTEKDLVKLRPLAPDDADLKALRIEVAPKNGADVLNEVAIALGTLDRWPPRPHDR